jgi:hypothetical protein
MSTTQIGRAKAIPHDLVADIHLNAEYQVLVCIRCRTAVCPGALVEHLTRFHGMGPGRVRNRVREYIKSFPHDYDNTTVRTPADGTVPQAELASIRGWLCRRCGFRTKSKKRARTHANQEHALKWGGVDEIIERVRLQTWFRQRQKYWVVVGAEKEGAAVEGRRSSPDGSSKGGSEKAEAERGTSDHNDAEGRGEAVTRGRKRREDDEGEKDRVKRVRFAGHVEVGGLEGLKQQLDRWSRQCVVCFLAGGRAAEAQTQHTVWECQQEAAEGIRMDSRHMAEGLRAVRAGGGCAGCGVPRVLCERWQWGGRWEESTGRCQYAGVMVSMMMAMATLGRASGRGQVGAWLRQDGLDPQGDEGVVFRWFGKPVWWEGVEAGQAVLVFMMLVRMNGL